MKHFNLICLLLCATLFVNASTIKVGGNSSLKSIKTALALANAGDTILVAPGHYKEGIEVTEKLLEKIPENQKPRVIKNLEYNRIKEKEKEKLVKQRKNI